MGSLFRISHFPFFSGSLSQLKFTSNTEVKHLGSFHASSSFSCVDGTKILIFPSSIGCRSSPYVQLSQIKHVNQRNQNIDPCSCILDSQSSIFQFKKHKWYFHHRSQKESTSGSYYIYSNKSHRAARTRHWGYIELRIDCRQSMHCVDSSRYRYRLHATPIHRNRLNRILPHAFDYDVLTKMGFCRTLCDVT